jgi:hypothetical protein
MKSNNSRTLKKKILSIQGTMKIVYIKPTISSIPLTHIPSWRSALTVKHKGKFIFFFKMNNMSIHTGESKFATFKKWIHGLHKLGLKKKK